MKNWAFLITADLFSTFSPAETETVLDKFSSFKTVRKFNNIFAV